MHFGRNRALLSLLRTSPSEACRPSCSLHSASPRSFAPFKTRVRALSFSKHVLVVVKF
jgi:hypothetical protein